MSRLYTRLSHKRLPAESPPATVRAYFATLLHEWHGVPEDEAASIAAAWRLGHWAELATYDLKTFRDLFGSEIGMLLYTYERDGLDNTTTNDTASAPAQRRPAAAAVAHLTTFLGVDPPLVLVQFFFLATVFFALTAFRDYHPGQEMSGTTALTSNHFLALYAFVVSYVFCLTSSRDGNVR